MQLVAVGCTFSHYDPTVVTRLTAGIYVCSNSVAAKAPTGSETSETYSGDAESRHRVLGLFTDSRV